MSGTQSPVEVSVREVKRMMDAREDFLLLDVREQKEYDTARIQGAKLVPLGDLPRQVEALREYMGRPVVTHCHKGKRSLQAAGWLHGQGFQNVRSMAGGIDEWSLKIDPLVPRY